MRGSISHLQLHCNCKKKIKQNKANTIKLPSHSTNLKEEKKVAQTKHQMEAIRQILSYKNGKMGRKNSQKIQVIHHTNKQTNNHVVMLVKN